MTTLIGWLSTYGGMLLGGVTLVMAAGVCVALAQRTPISRLRACEGAMLCALCWLIAACIPLPRFSPLNAAESNDAAGHHVETDVRPVASMDNAPFDGGSPMRAPSMYVKGATKATPRGEPRAARKPANSILRQSVAPPRQSSSTAAAKKTLAEPNVTYPSTNLKPREALAGAYLIAVAAGIVWLFLGRVLLFQIMLGGRRLAIDDPLLDGLICGEERRQRIPRILATRRCGKPFSFGLFRPTVVVPALLYHENAAALRQAVRHELAHLRQRDAAGRLLFNVAFPLFYLHPLYWWLRRQACFTAELIADDVAAQATSRQSYMRDLVTLLRQSDRRERWVLGVARVVGSKSQFYRRMENLVHRSTNLSTRCSNPRRLILSACFAAILLTCGAMMGMRTSGAKQELQPAPLTDPSTTANEDSSKTTKTPWYINNVLSTSSSTPGFAREVPLDQTVRVRGTVYDAQGRPAAGAEVWAASVFVEPPHRERVFADEQGRFSLRLKPFYGKHERWSIRAYKGKQGGEYNNSLGWLRLADSMQPAALVIRMSLRDTIRGKVFADESGRPIPDARLYTGDGRVIVTNDQGRFTIGGLKQGNHRLVVVAHQRERKRVMFDNSLRPGAELEIFLKKGGQIRGKVIDHEGKPVPFAYVEVLGSGTALALDGRCAVCNERGEFVWEGAPLDAAIRSMDAGHPGYSTFQHSNLSPTPAGEKGLAFRLKKRSGGADAASKDTASSNKPTPVFNLRDLAGVVKGPQGRPVADAIVRWGATQYEDIKREVRTDRSGRFILHNTPDREAYITAVAPGLAPRFVHVNQGEKEIAIHLEEGRLVGGVVVSRSGKPLAGVQVYTVIPSPDPSLCNPYWISERQTTTGAQGKFQIDGLPPRGVLFDFVRSDLTEIRSKPLELGKTDHKIQMSASGAIWGRVISPDGDPVRNFRILIGFPRRRQPGDKQLSYSAVYGSIGVSFTDDDGRFVFSDVGAGGAYRVRANVPGFGNAIVDRVVARPVNELRERDKIVLRLRQPNALRVRVLDARDDRPLAGADVILIHDSTGYDRYFSWNSSELGWRGKQTAADGWARFPKLASGEATVVVRREGFAHHRFGWRKQEKEFVVRLAPETALAGVVQSTSGKPLTNVYLTISSLDQQHVHWMLGEQDQGKFAFRELPAGWYRLNLRDERRSLGKKVVRLEVGQTKSLAIGVDVESGKTTFDLKEDKKEEGRPSRANAVQTSVNGKVVGDSTLKEAIAEHREKLASQGQAEVAAAITEERMRKAIRQAVQDEQQKLEKSERPNLAFREYFLKHCEPVFLRIADRGEWPLGTYLTEGPPGDSRLYLGIATPTDTFTNYTLTLAAPK